MILDGDPQLADRLSTMLRSKQPVAAVAMIDGDEVRIASVGTELGSDFEIGSVSKGLTGLLYVDALERGEITPETVLGDHLPLADAPAARITLASIAVHRSGLPTLPKSSRPWRRQLRLWRHGTTPYSETVDQLLAQTRGVTPGRPRPRYSNLGFELLGHAVASAAGTTYPKLLRDRICTPLGIDLYVPANRAELRSSAIVGRSRSGRPREPWTGEAIGPAGGIRATITDLAQLARAVLDGSAPGIGALDPIERFGTGSRIGAAWLTTDVAGQSITWHNGGTGGFRSWMGFDRETGRAAAILSATARSVDGQGFQLLRRGRCD